MTNFATGDRVALKGKSVPLVKGTVQGVTINNIYYIIETDSGTIQKCTENNLMSEADGLLEEKNLREAQVLAKKKAAEKKAAKEAEEARLEAEFQVVKHKIAAKLKEAGTVFQEAIDLAAQHNKSITGYDFDSDLGPLYSAMENAGWRTSSLMC
jgi:hypothetical protein